jgi:DNA/RNA-binding domain of Phe-tRNA-synthetase-like protein
MRFGHHPDIWRRFPELAASTLFAGGIHAGVTAAPQVERFNAIARQRLDAAGSESELPEIKAWRGVFSRMGLKPTQYRCASESLLRRFRKEGSLPQIHPLIDLCNAASIAFAIPVAALDVDQVAWPLQVRPAGGAENYQSFSGELEHPEPGEVTFCDAQGQAHARRWTHRQSGLSAIRDQTRSVLIVMEAVHADAATDVQRLADALEDALSQVWNVTPQRGLLTAAAPDFEFRA